MWKDFMQFSMEKMNENDEKWKFHQLNPTWKLFQHNANSSSILYSIFVRISLISIVDSGFNSAWNDKSNKENRSKSLSYGLKSCILWSRSKSATNFLLLVVAVVVCRLSIFRVRSCCIARATKLVLFYFFMNSHTACKWLPCVHYNKYLLFGLLSTLFFLLTKLVLLYWCVFSVLFYAELATFPPFSLSVFLPPVAFSLARVLSLSLQTQKKYVFIVVDIVVFSAVFLIYF